MGKKTIEYMPVVEPRIYTYYKLVICQDIIYTRALKNIMELPQIVQCVLNSSSAQILKEKTGVFLPQIALQSICGQKSKTTRSRKSVANFQLREKALLGCTVTLRGAALYSFLDQYITLVSCNQAKLQNVVARTVTKRREGKDVNFGEGAFTLFPTLEPHWLTFADTGGFNCTFCTSSRGHKELILFFTALQFPVQP